MAQPSRPPRKPVKIAESTWQNSLVRKEIARMLEDKMPVTKHMSLVIAALLTATCYLFIVIIRTTDYMSESLTNIAGLCITIFIAMIVYFSFRHILTLNALKTNMRNEVPRPMRPTVLSWSTLLQLCVNIMIVSAIINLFWLKLECPWQLDAVLCLALFTQIFLGLQAQRTYKLLVIRVSVFILVMEQKLRQQVHTNEA